MLFRSKKLVSLGYPDTPLDQLERSGEGKNEALYLNTIATGARLESALQQALIAAIDHLPIAKMMHYQIHIQLQNIQRQQEPLTPFVSMFYKCIFRE